MTSVGSFGKYKKMAEGKLVAIPVDGSENSLAAVEYAVKTVLR